MIRHPEPPSTATTADRESDIVPLSKLRNLGLEMGYQCNVRCAMCSQVDFRPRPKAIDAILFARIRPALEFVDTLTISGGEPTIMPAAYRLLSYVREHHPRIRLVSTTNGMCFKGIWEDAFLEQGISLNISLNAIDPAIYSRVVQFARQSVVIETIDRLVQRRRTCDSALKIRLSTVITDETVHEMPLFIHWAAARGVDEVALATDQIRALTRHPPAQVQAFVREAYSTERQHPELTVFALPEFDADYAARNKLDPVRAAPPHGKSACPCKVPFDSLFVNPYGYAYPCPSTSYYFGNLVRRPLAEVWNSAAARRFRRRVSALDFRDCLNTCQCNVRPVGYLRSQFRKAVWITRRDPRHIIQKGLRKFGLTSALIRPSRSVVALTSVETDPAHSSR